MGIGHDHEHGRGSRNLAIAFVLNLLFAVFELAGGRQWRESAKAGAGAMVGFFVGALGKVICCVIMIAIFYFSALWNAGKGPLHSGESLRALNGAQLIGDFALHDQGTSRFSAALYPAL